MLTDHASRRALFYRQLASLESAGVPVRQALPKVRVSGAQLAEMKAYLQAAVERGEDLGRAFADAPHLHPFERQLMAAAVQVGRLSETWNELAAYFENKAAMRRELIGHLTYPVMVLHVAIFLPPIYLLFTTGPAAYFLATVPLFLAIWAFILGLPRLLHALEGSAVLDAALWHLPVVANIYRLNARRTALAVLRAAQGAGIIASEAFASAGRACQSRGLRRQFLHASEEAQNGQPMTLVIANLTLLPDAVRDGMIAGAESGSLPETLERLEHQMADEARMRQKVAMTLLGVLLFLAVAAVVAVKVISFYQAQYNQLLNT